MVTALPKWLMQSYARLHAAFGNKEFDFEQARKILKKKNLISPILSELKRHGWLAISLHPNDSRKRIYKLKKPEEAIAEIAKAI